MNTHSTTMDPAEVAAADKRWARWVAKGVERDRKSQKRVRMVAAVLLFGVVAWLAKVLILE